MKYRKPTNDVKPDAYQKRFRINFIHYTKFGALNEIPDLSLEAFYFSETEDSYAIKFIPCSFNRILKNKIIEFMLSSLLIPHKSYVLHYPFDGEFPEYTDGLVHIHYFSKQKINDSMFKLQIQEIIREFELWDFDQNDHQILYKMSNENEIENKASLMLRLKICPKFSFKIIERRPSLDNNQIYLLDANSGREIDFHKYVSTSKGECKIIKLYQKKYFESKDYDECLNKLCALEELEKIAFKERGKVALMKLRAEINDLAFVEEFKNHKKETYGRYNIVDVDQHGIIGDDLWDKNTLIFGPESRQKCLEYISHLEREKESFKKNESMHDESRYYDEMQREGEYYRWLGDY